MSVSESLWAFFHLCIFGVITDVNLWWVQEATTRVSIVSVALVRHRSPHDVVADLGSFRHDFFAI